MNASTASSRIEEAVWQNPLASRRGMLERLFTFWFNSFVYNQIWEDPRVDLIALDLVPDQSRLLTISSGGCNVLNYLIERPAAIAAIDMNRSHISLLRLKLTAIEHLPGYDEFYLFFGCGDDAANRLNYDRYLRQHLDPVTREFWEGGSPLRRTFFGRRVDYFTKNFYDYAKLGYFLRFVHRIARAQRCDVTRILSASTPEEQETAFQEDIAPAFGHWLIRIGDRFPVALFSLGIPPQQYRAMQADADQAGGMTALLRERVHRLACNTPIAENYFGWQAFSRSYNRASTRALPAYLRPENFSDLRANLDRVHTYVASFQEFLAGQAPGAFDRFVLLDAQDWMKPEQIAELWSQIARVGPPGSRIIFRTAARKSPIEESLPASLMARFEYEETLSMDLHAKDRSAIYGGFHVYALRPVATP
jgi:S-adenosylmethionine-diacylglycerol 3-amino-3-carboxypropyl transferase